MGDSGILDILKKAHEKASLAKVKEARRLENAGTPNSKPIAPEQPAPLPGYNSVYVPSVADQNQTASV
jgi:hypothetical protein